jgi:protease I
VDVVEADVVSGADADVLASLRTEIPNAGRNSVDEPVYIDHGLVTSRAPDDLQASAPRWSKS